MILLLAWKMYLKELKLSIKIMPHDVSTRWNLTYNMLCFAILYRKAIENITSDRRNDLQQFELSEEEWAIVQEVCDVLKVRDVAVWLCMSTFADNANYAQILKDATLYFSHGTPNLPTVIPAMDHIDTVFMNATLPSSKNHPAVHAAIEMAKRTLNKYYSLTDSVLRFG
jgi:hypothetical protein